MQDQRDEMRATNCCYLYTYLLTPSSPPAECVTGSLTIVRQLRHAPFQPSCRMAPSATTSPAQDAAPIS